MRRNLCHSRLSLFFVFRVFLSVPLRSHNVRDNINKIKSFNAPASASASGKKAPIQRKKLVREEEAAAQKGETFHIKKQQMSHRLLNRN